MARIGTVGYLNARPLSDHIDIDRHTLVLANPAEIARMLATGQLDVALVPVVAVLGDTSRLIVPGVCVGAEGPVESVLLVGATPPEQWTKVLLDGVSRTSVVLARLLLAGGPGIASGAGGPGIASGAGGPLAKVVAPGVVIEDVPAGTALASARKGTAALVIGDAARQLPEHLTHRIDLAQEWTRFTGLPFVFAVWAGRRDLDPAVVTHLAEVGRRGIAELSRRYAGEDLRYLSQALRYPLDDAALMGLRRFGALAVRAGLLADDGFALFSPERQRARGDVDGALAAASNGGAQSIASLLVLLRDAPIADLAAAADLKRRGYFPGDAVTVGLGATVDASDGLAAVRDAVAAGATRLSVVGEVDAAWLAGLADAAGGVRVAVQGPVAVAPADLVAAGVSAVFDPSGATSERVRANHGHAPLSSWLAFAARAAACGCAIEATVGVGQGETDEELAAHLLALRGLSGLSVVRVFAAEAPGPLGEVANTAADLLRATAVARLVLPETVRLEASPGTEGLGMMQFALQAGCDSAGWVSVGGPTRHEVEEALVAAGAQAAWT